MTVGVSVDVLTGGDRTARMKKRSDILHWANANCQGKVEIHSGGLLRQEKCRVWCELEQDATLITLRWALTE